MKRSLKAGLPLIAGFCVGVLALVIYNYLLGFVIDASVVLLRSAKRAVDNPGGWPLAPLFLYGPALAAIPVGLLLGLTLAKSFQMRKLPFWLCFLLGVNAPIVISAISVKPASMAALLTGIYATPSFLSFQLSCLAGAWLERKGSSRVA